LNKILYGLKQFGRQWNIIITIFLQDNGYKKLISEKYILIKTEKGKAICIIGLYVDDMVITGNNNKIKKKKKKKKKKKTEISKSEPINFILGIKVENINKNTLYYHTRKLYQQYIREVQYQTH